MDTDYGREVPVQIRFAHRASLQYPCNHPQPLKYDEVAGTLDNPREVWSGQRVTDSKNWLLVMEMVECDLPPADIITYRDGQWLPEYPNNQTALIRCKLPPRLV